MKIGKTAIATVISSLLSPQIFAQDDALSDIEKIEVISYKQAYRGNVPVKELPQAVSIISAQELDAMGISNFQTALSLDSSLSRQNNFGGLWESFAIRGFSGDEKPTFCIFN